MKTSQKGIDLIKAFENCRLNAYKDSAGIPTIGFGNTMYQSGKKVKLGDKITQAEADVLLKWAVGLKEVAVASMTDKYHLNQNQFDAIMCFTYNCGIGALASSTLLKKLKADKNDPSIASEFMRWDKATVGGKLVPLAGLTRRRRAESALYFS